MARARAGERALRLHQDVRVCCSEGLPSPPTRLCPGPSPPPRPLTFLHRDGRLLLPKPQQDEEEDERDENLEGQDPLGRAG